MAIDYNADLMTVTSFQILRLITIIVMVPFLVQKYAHKRITPPEDVKYVKKKKEPAKIIFPCGLSILGAFIFHIIDLPAAYLTGSLFFKLLHP
jgi:uncharacterized membrane protein AbrB (regulator of aidB expression)